MIKFFVSLIFLTSPLIARAGFLDGLGCIEYGNCGLEDIATGFLLLIKLMLGAMGAVALVYFVYGGVQWLISSGNAERVKKGKDIMTNTIFAIIVAFGGYLILDFFVNQVLNVKEPYRITTISCQGKGPGSPCGEPGSLMVCSGTFSQAELVVYNEICISQCVYAGLKNNYKTACLPENYNPQDYNGAYAVSGCTSCCPGEQVCATDGSKIY
ncbi:pilin [Patescibacteria group bacterium]|nr:pilin [Patescibacteria group bacterium]